MPLAAIAVLSAVLGQTAPGPDAPLRPVESPPDPGETVRDPVLPPPPPETTRPPSPPPNWRLWRDLAGIGGELVLSTGGLLLGLQLCAMGPPEQQANCATLWPHGAAGAALGALLGATAGVWISGRLLDQQGSLLATLAGSGVGTALGVAAVAVAVGALGAGGWAAILLGAVAFFLPTMGAAVGFEWRRRPDPPRAPIAPTPSRLPAGFW